MGARRVNEARGQRVVTREQGDGANPTRIEHPPLLHAVDAFRDAAPHGVELIGQLLTTRQRGREQLAASVVAVGGGSVATLHARELSRSVVTEDLRAVGEQAILVIVLPLYG